jgi:hypothetical protein
MSLFNPALTPGKKKLSLCVNRKNLSQSRKKNPKARKIKNPRINSKTRQSTISNKINKSLLNHAKIDPNPAKQLVTPADLSFDPHP